MPDNVPPAYEPPCRDWDLGGRYIWLKPAAAILIAALYLNVSFAQQLPPVPSLNPTAQKIKEKVRKIGVGQPLTVIQQDGSEHHGNLLSIQTETFSIQEFPSASGPPVTTTIAYSDVKKIQKGIRRKSAKARYDWIILSGIIVMFIGLYAAASAT